MANQEHVDILGKGMEIWNEWRRERDRVISPDLSNANLSNANLRGFSLWGANLHGANLVNANLARADLTSVDLGEANLSNANLSKADLRGSDFTRADPFSGDCFIAKIKGANLYDANFSGVRLAGASFINVDLSGVKGLDTLHHRGPSEISMSTIYRSGGNIPEIFLRGAGVPDSFIEYMRLLVGKPIDFYSCFISYSSKDQNFAEHIYADLQSKGVRCWFAPHDLRPGDYHHSRIDEAIRFHEKVLLLLSEHSVNSHWVKHEVQIAQAREVTQDCTVLFPLRLDRAVMQTSKDWAAQLRESRHIGDFTGWQDETAYQQAFTTLLRQLTVRPFA